jgi:hypothetical protein
MTNEFGEEFAVRTEVVRGEVFGLVRQAPFRPFVLNLENGDRITIEHPENIAFDPGTNGTRSGSSDFYVISGNLRFFGTFDAVTSVALADTEGPAGS